MKRILISLMAAVLAVMTPVNCFASRNVNGANTEEAVYADSNESYLMVTRDTEESYDLERYIIAFKPTSVTATAKSGGIAVRANITTAAQRVMIQYSTDKSFKKGVMTKSFGNTQYAGAVIGTVKDYEKLQGDPQKNPDKWHYYYSLRILAQNKTNLTYRKIEGYTYEGYHSAPAIYIEDATVEAARKKIPCAKTFTVTNVKNAKKYYVRIRSQYEALGQRVYSQWVTVKVQ